MGFGFHNVKHVSLPVQEAAASRVIPIIRADQSITIKRVTLFADAAGTATGATWALQNWGTAGTAIKAGAAGTVCAPINGTALAARTPRDAAVVGGSAVLAEGEFLVLAYTKGAGDTFPEKQVNVLVEYVDGVGA